MTTTPSTNFAAVYNQSTQTLDNQDSNPFIQHLQYFEFKLDFTSSTSTEWLSNSNPNATASDGDSDCHPQPHLDDHHGDNKSNNSSGYELNRPHIFSFNNVHLQNRKVTTTTPTRVNVTPASKSHIDSRSSTKEQKPNTYSIQSTNHDCQQQQRAVDHEDAKTVDLDFEEEQQPPQDNEEEEQDEVIIEDPEEEETDMTLMLNIDYDMDSQSDIAMNQMVSTPSSTSYPHSKSKPEQSTNTSMDTKSNTNTNTGSASTTTTATHQQRRDHYYVILEAYLKPFQLVLLIPPEIRNLILLYFRNCTILYMLHGGKNCGVSCISTKLPLCNQSVHTIDTKHRQQLPPHHQAPQTEQRLERELNKLVNFKIYDIKSYHKQKNTPILTTTFMNEWDLNGMKLCLGKDVNISPSLLPSGFKSTERRSCFDVLFRAQQSANSYYYFQNYRISAIVINPMDVLYHDIEAIQRKHKYIRTCLTSSYHNTIKTFEIELPAAADIARFDMVWSAHHGLLIVGDASDIQSLQLTQSGDACPDVRQRRQQQQQHVNNNDEFDCLQLPQWRYVTEIPSELKWKTQRTLQILNDYDSAQTEQLFVAGGVNIAITTHLLMGAFPFNHQAVTNKAAIYNLNSSEWTELADLNHGRRAGASCFCRRQRQIYVGGGLHYHTSDVVEVFDMNKYHLNWHSLPRSIYKHQEKLSMFMNECISPSLLYCISKAGAECHDLRANKWIDLSQRSALGTVSQCLSNQSNILSTI